MYKIFDINNSNTLLVRKYNLNIKKKYNSNSFSNGAQIGPHNRYSRSNNLDNLYNLNSNSNSNSNNSNHSNNTLSNYFYLDSNNMDNSNKSINTKNNSINKTVVIIFLFF